MRMHRILLAFAVSSVFIAGAARSQPTAGGTLVVSSPAFAPGQPIPRALTCQGGDKTPPLRWSNVPPETKSVAILIDDPDAPQGIHTHWIVVNLPPTVTSLSAGARLPVGTLATDYHGPCPPSGTHHYRFQVYALDVFLPHPRDRDAFLKAIDGHVLAEGMMVGTYTKQR